MTVVFRWWTSSRNAARLGAAGLLLGAGLLAGVPQAAGEGNIPPMSEGAFKVQAQVKTERAESLPSKQAISTIPTSFVEVHVMFRENEGHAYLVDGIRPSGSAGESVPPFGKMRKFKVRTLAFGIVPAEVTLEIRQVVYGKDPGVSPPSGSGLRGYLEPWVLSNLGDREKREELKGRVMVRVVEMSLDGTRVDIGGNCATAHPGWVSLTASDGYDVLDGGTFEGTIDIPGFSGCQGVSDLLTSAISGPGNPLVVHQTLWRPDQG